MSRSWRRTGDSPSRSTAKSTGSTCRCSIEPGQPPCGSSSRLAAVRADVRTIVHLSDLHFDRVDPAVVDALARFVPAIAPDVIAVSGDLTQRARTHQFAQARAFLDSLPGPRLVVPGNHDVPLYNVIARFVNPLGRYRRYITDDLQPHHADEEMLLLGANTTRSLTRAGGRLRPEDLRRI